MRALSSCYVERRAKLTSGSALDGAGKRAAFALFYAPVHHLTVTHVVRALGAHTQQHHRLIDLGCGTGAAGSAWALACEPSSTLAGVDRHPWAVQEANWTYRHLGLRGRAVVGDVVKPIDTRESATGIVLAYVVNELPPDKRRLLLDHIRHRTRRGAAVLVVEPIARSVTGWWTEWTSALGDAGVRTDEWRFPATLPALLSDIASGAGLNPRELTARTIYVPPRG